MRFVPRGPVATGDRPRTYNRRLMLRIDSPEDERLDLYRLVADHDRLAARGLFVAEGRLVVRRLLAGPLEAQSLLLTEAAWASLEDVLITGPSLPVYVVSQAVMNGVTGFNFHRGCLALGERPPDRPWQALATGARRLVALERVGNADNVGGVFRTAAAFGADGVLLQADCGDPLYRKSIRTSMGASLAVPFAWARSWPLALKELADRGWVTAAMTPAADAPGLRELAEAARERPFVVVLGHEGEGMTPSAVDACTHRARIAMADGVDSLNVVTAAAIALYELTRDGAGSSTRPIAPIAQG